ncbi:MAG: phosphate acyltransferase PlsX, partial [Atopostipes suicloacalis]|nr:phosphate acyltransferase PlsX [Atopostipes suicloacalis]MDN6731388.1 phosphate acyltransferase PlsX [Atopostipes suicloacalis]
MRIAIDAMGGDDAPKVVVEGVEKAARSFPDTKMIMYGAEDQIRSYLTKDLMNIEIIHTDEKIEGDDDPVRSIRRKKKASMVLAAKSVKDQENDALFSAGNTGALLAAGTLIVGRIRGIDRPGLMASMITINEDSDKMLLLDLGANADTKPINLSQYAIMGNFYAEHVNNIKNPRIALLNNGTEEGKGNKLTKEAYDLLKANEEINFIGNKEARDLFNGIADVLVMDGFTGNAVLKSMEGTANTILTTLKKSIKNGGLKSKLGALLLKDSLKNLSETLNYKKLGGAILLGVRAPVLKTHGSTDQEAVYQTLKQTREILKSEVVKDTVEYFEK